MPSRGLSAFSNSTTGRRQQKGRGRLAPAFCLFALKTRASTSVVTSRKQCAIGNGSPRRQMRLCKCYRGRGFSEQVVHSEYALPGFRAHFFYRLSRRWPGESSLNRGPQLNSHNKSLEETYTPLRIFSTSASAVSALKSLIIFCAGSLICGLRESIARSV